MAINLKKLPFYSNGEESVNVISHFFGFLFSLGVLGYFISVNVIRRLSFLYMLPYYVYSLSMMIVFFVSTFYHFQKQGSVAKAVSRIIDHSDIYLLVAGTYTPICIYGATFIPAGLSMLIIEWVISIVGMLLVIFGLNNKICSLISHILYIILGWLIIFFIYFIDTKSKMFLFILLGGIAYSIGAILYAIGKKKKWFHSIFHFFILLAAILQFIGLYFLLG